MRNISKLFALALVVTASFWQVGCDEGVNPEQQQVLLSPEQQIKRDNLDIAAKALTNIISNQDIVNEIKDGVDIRYDGDENILFKDMLDSSESIYKTRKTSQFSTAFKSSLSKQTQKSGDLLSWLTQHNAQIYWPYSELWDKKTRPTITFHPMDGKGQSNIGYKVNDQGVLSKVGVIDEEYAVKNPVIIVRLSEFGDALIEKFRLKPVGQKTADKMITPNHDKVANSEEFRRTFLGLYKLTQHWDGLFDGGSDIRILRASANVQRAWNGANYQVSGEYETPYVATVTRTDIRFANWNYANTAFDHDWEAEQASQYIVVYEEDSPKSKEVSFGVNIDRSLIDYVGGIFKPSAPTGTPPVTAPPIYTAFNPDPSDGGVITPPIFSEGFSTGAPLLGYNYKKNVAGYDEIIYQKLWPSKTFAEYMRNKNLPNTLQWTYNNTVITNYCINETEQGCIPTSEQNTARQGVSPIMFNSGGFRIAMPMY